MKKKGNEPIRIEIHSFADMVDKNIGIPIRAAKKDKQVVALMKRAFGVDISKWPDK